MKRSVLIGLFLISIIFSERAWGEETTLLLTLKAEVNHSPLKNELRLGLWKTAKDGLDPLDQQAMLNGLFDAYFELPSKTNGSVPFLWWDIRSSDSEQEWKLRVNAPPGQPVVMEWKQVLTGAEKVSFVLVDPETGMESYFDQESGTLRFLTQGSKTLTIKTINKY